MLLGPDATEAEAAAVSPATHVAHMPPTMLFQGTDDLLLRPFAGNELQRMLLEAGVPAELHTLAQANHEFDTTPSLMDVCIAAVDSFVQRYVIDPESFTKEVFETNMFATMAAALES
jgi:acetyl esterase/lipase